MGQPILVHLVLSKKLDIKYGEALVCLVCTTENSVQNDFFIIY